MTVAEVIAAYWKHADVYYRKNGEPTSEVGSIREAMRPLRRLYGDTLAIDFGPAALEACQQSMIEAKLSRGVINARVARIKRCFKWATSKELVPPHVFQAIQTVANLKRGRSEARETKPVRPVPEAHIDATLPYLLPPVHAIVELQLLTGARPGEIRTMRGCNLDMAGKLWTYRPDSHKSEHTGRERVIYLGPRAQSVIEPFLATNLNAYLFSPARALAEHNADRRSRRRTPMTPSQARRQRKQRPKRPPKALYSKETLVRAITRACDQADEAAKKAKGLPADKERQVPQWSPGQLRHNAATRFRKEYGLEVAQIMLGHSTAEVTQIYAERDAERAMPVVSRIG